MPSRVDRRGNFRDSSEVAGDVNVSSSLVTIGKRNVRVTLNFSVWRKPLIRPVWRAWLCHDAAEKSADRLLSFARNLHVGQKGIASSMGPCLPRNLLFLPPIICPTVHQKSVPVSCEATQKDRDLFFCLVRIVLDDVALGNHRRR